MDWLEMLINIGPVILTAIIDYFIGSSKLESNSLVEMLLLSVKKAIKS